MTNGKRTETLTPAEVAQLSAPALEYMAREAMTASGRVTARRILLKRERAITASFRRYLELDTLLSVKLHRPRWMPRRLYRWLLRTIIFEEIATK